MKKCQSLSYTKWDCKYHVFALLGESQVAGILVAEDRKSHHLGACQELGELLDTR